MVVLDELKRRLRLAFPDGEIYVASHDDVHFEARIQDVQFNSLSTIAQHRLVYQAIGPMMGRECHALTLETLEKIV